MKKLIVLTLSISMLIILRTAFSLRDNYMHSGVRIEATPIVTNGSIIRMSVVPIRSNQTIREVTYELVDADTVNVHISLDFLARNEIQDEQVLQLLITTETEIHFLVNEKEIDEYLLKDGVFWKTYA
jgi:hypothetical protein